MAAPNKDYKVEMLKSTKVWRKQRFYWRVKAVNGQILLTSEMYVHMSFTRRVSKKFALALGCEWVSLV